MLSSAIRIARLVGRRLLFMQKNRTRHNAAFGPDKRESGSVK